jgi:predicted SAM-dependent methyltransferase
VRSFYSRIIRNRRFQLRRLNLNVRYLNVGCGPNITPGFAHLDWDWQPGIDLCWDVRKGLPFSDHSLKGIYSEHCLEHLKLEDTREVLKEFHRILERGGLVRIVLPSAELYLNLYRRAKDGEPVVFPYPESGFTPMMYVNKLFSGYGHCYGYDAETLALLLREAGFSDVREQKFRVGQDSILLIDNEGRSIESFYMEARAG